jgi:hypothetical protein
LEGLMPGTSERLTYFLGICVAVISWSVTQLSQRLTEDNIVAYQTEIRSDKSSKIVKVTFKNVSRSRNPGEVEAKFVGDENNCVQEIKEVPMGVSKGRSEVGTELPAASWTGTLDSLPPGAGMTFAANVLSNCNVNVSLKFGDDKTRLVPFGVETFLIERQVAIILTLVIGFAVVFAITFVVSLLGKGE